MHDAISNIDTVTRPHDGLEERVLSNPNLPKPKGAGSLEAKPPHVSPRLGFSLSPRIFASPQPSSSHVEQK